MEGRLGLINRSGYCWIVLAAGTLAIFAALGLGRFGYTVVLPSMQAGLGLANTEAGILASANLTGYLVLSVVGGALASHFGPRVVIAAGLVVAGIGMVMTGMAGGLVSAAVWRTVTGIGSGAANIAVMGMLAAWFPVARRGLASGIAVTGSAVAMIIIGPLVPGIISRYGDQGWRTCWYLFGALALVVAVLSLILIRNKPSAVLATPYGIPARGESAPKPAGWSAVYRSGIVWRMGIVYSACGFSYIIYMTFFVKHLVMSAGYSRPAAGALFMVMGWAALGCGLIWGHISDRIGRAAAVGIVYLIHATSFLIFAFSTGPFWLAVSAVIFGISAFSIPAIMAAACGDVLGPRMAPAALGFITVFFGIGQMAGPSIAGAIADAAGSFAPAFILAAVVALVGAAGALALHRAGRIRALEHEHQ